MHMRWAHQSRVYEAREGEMSMRSERQGAELLMPSGCSPRVAASVGCLLLSRSLIARQPRVLAPGIRVLVVLIRCSEDAVGNALHLLLGDIPVDGRHQLLLGRLLSLDLLFERSDRFEANLLLRAELIIAVNADEALCSSLFLVGLVRGRRLIERNARLGELSLVLFQLRLVLGDILRWRC